MTFWAKSPPYQGGDLGEVSCCPTVTCPFTRPLLYENISSVRCDQKHNLLGPSEKDDLSFAPSTNGKGLSHTILDREVRPSCWSNELRTTARSCRFLAVGRQPVTSSPPHGMAKAKTTCPCLTPVPRGDPVPGVHQALYPAENLSTSLEFRPSLRCQGLGAGPSVQSAMERHRFPKIPGQEVPCAPAPPGGLLCSRDVRAD